MANLCITRRCRRHCSFCFARHELARDSTMDMPPETYATALAFLKHSDFPEARILGGEPTEHPRFCAYVSQALDKGFRVVVFSGGLVDRPVVAYMASLPAERFSVVLNAADPASDSQALVKRQQEICRTLGEKVMLGVNIRSPQADPAWLLDWVAQFGLSRTVRVGMAHPIWGGTNDFFRLRGPRVLPVFERFAAKAARIGIHVGFDCGFTPCMFSEVFVDARFSLIQTTISHRSNLTKHR